MREKHTIIRYAALVLLATCSLLAAAPAAEAGRLPDDGSTGRTVTPSATPSVTPSATPSVTPSASPPAGPSVAPSAPAVTDPSVTVVAPTATAPDRDEPTPRTFDGLGFDTCQAPSLDTMRAWLDSPYRAVGVYFGGRARACADQPELDRSWVRDASDLGWRMLPIYVGSQAPCVFAANKKPYPIDGSDPWANGTQEGADAVERAGDTGFAEGSALYLDMEAYDQSSADCADPTLDFVRAWNREVRRRGYLPGLYSSSDAGIKHIERARRGDTADLPTAVWFARWKSPATVDDEPALDQDAWQPHRRIHQYGGNVTESYGGHRLAIDQDRIDAPVAVVAADH